VNPGQKVNVLVAASTQVRGVLSRNVPQVPAVLRRVGALRQRVPTIATARPA